MGGGTFGDYVGKVGFRDGEIVGFLVATLDGFLVGFFKEIYLSVFFLPPYNQWSFQEFCYSFFLWILTETPG